MYEPLQTAFVAEFTFPHYTFFSIPQLVCFSCFGVPLLSACLRLSPLTGREEGKLTFTLWRYQPESV